MSHVLVTGGAGFIGSHLCARLLADGHQVTCLDNRGIRETPLHSLLLTRSHSFAYQHCDITIPYVRNFLERHEPFDAVIHLAALAGVRASLTDPLGYANVNIQGTLNILEYCRLAQVCHALFASSSSVYGERASCAFQESDALPVPASPYAATKRAGELFCQTYAHLYGMRIACLRFFSAYGPYQRPGLAIHTFAKKLLADERLSIFGDGSTQRDYTYVEDIVEGLLLAWQWTRQEGTHACEIFNLGSGAPVDLLTMVAQLGNALDRIPRYDFQPTQPGDVPYTCADLRKSAAVLGYQPQVRFTQGIQRFAAWFLAHAPAT